MIFLLVQVKNFWIFTAASAAVVSYLLYMMIRKRRGERPGVPDREPEL
jgi:hypothetical protein